MAKKAAKRAPRVKKTVETTSKPTPQEGPTQAEISVAWEKYRTLTKARPGEELAFTAGYKAGAALPPPGTWQQVSGREWRCDHRGDILVIKQFKHGERQVFFAYCGSVYLGPSDDLEAAQRKAEEGDRAVQSHDGTPEAALVKDGITAHYRPPTAEERRAAVLAGKGEATTAGRAPRAPKAPRAPGAPATGGKLPGGIDPAKVFTVTSTSNPRKAGTGQHDRFETLRSLSGKTVREVLAGGGDKHALAYAVETGHAKLE